MSYNSLRDKWLIHQNWCDEHTSKPKTYDTFCKEERKEYWARNSINMIRKKMKSNDNIMSEKENSISVRVYSIK